MALHRIARALVTGGLLALLLVTGGVPATAKGGEIGGTGQLYLFSDSFGTEADRRVTYGRPLDRVLVGDWDGDGVDTLAVRRGREYHFKNSLDGGAADRVVLYGRAEDTVLVGDWDGDRVASLAVRRAPVAPQPEAQPPVLAYGTLRSGQSAHSVIGRTVKEALSRAPGLDLYMISGYSFPWAVPNAANTAGIAGELFWFPSSTYWSDIARLDRYERYDPSRPASEQLYTRERRATSYGVGAWVYVATPRWASIARDRGTRIPSGDYVRW